MAALHTSTSIAPSSASPSLTIEPTAAASATSASTGTARTPAVRHSAATVSSSSRLTRVFSTRSAPSAANASAMARPMLRLAPVMSAILPLSLIRLRGVRRGCPPGASIDDRRLDELQEQLPVVAARRAGAAGVVLLRHGHVEQLDRLSRRPIGLERLRQPADLVLRHQERGVSHLERREQALREESAERRARDHLDHTAQHVRREAVLPGGPGLMGQWHFRQPLDLLGRADVAPVDADLAVKLLHPGVPGEARIHESRGVAEQVLNRHLALGRYQRVDRLPVSGSNRGTLTSSFP